MKNDKNLRKEKHRRSNIMERRVLLKNITLHADAYRKVHSRTAAFDLELVEAYCTGSSAVHVALNHHCSESTVYRALDRVRCFLRLQSPEDRWTSLIAHIMEQSPNCGDCSPEDFPDMVYEAYQKFNPVDDAFCGLSRSCHRTGFTEGLQLGLRLYEELQMRSK